MTIRFSLQCSTAILFEVCDMELYSNQLQRFCEMNIVLHVIELCKKFSTHLDPFKLSYGFLQSEADSLRG